MYKVQLTDFGHVYDAWHGACRYCQINITGFAEHQTGTSTWALETKPAYRDNTPWDTSASYTKSCLDQQQQMLAALCTCTYSCHNFVSDSEELTECMT